jgi:hypothetical protein
VVYSQITFHHLVILCNDSGESGEELLVAEGHGKAFDNFQQVGTYVQAIGFEEVPINASQEMGWRKPTSTCCDGKEYNRAGGDQKSQYNLRSCQRYKRTMYDNSGALNPSPAISGLGLNPAFHRRMRSG